MRTIVDYETGEITQVEDENELAERKLIEVGAIDENTSDFLNKYLAIKEQYEVFRYVLERAMRENGIKKWETDDFIFIAKEESTRTSFDTKAFAEKYPDLYNKYQRVSNVKPSLMVKEKKQ